MADDLSVKDAANAIQKVAAYSDGTRLFMKHIGVAHTSGGGSAYRYLDLDETGRVVKASAGRLYGLSATNLHATDKRYVKVYDKATAPTEADTPIFTLPVPATGLPVALPVPDIGVDFANGISLRATTALADADTGAPGANEVVIFGFYK